jgi:hypothetical protein
MDDYSSLTNEELIPLLQTREDLTLVEHELLDRLIRANDTIVDLEKDLTNLRGRLTAVRLVDTRVPA